MELYVDQLSGFVSKIVKKVMKYYYTIIIYWNHLKHCFDTLITNIWQRIM